MTPRLTVNSHLSDEDELLDDEDASRRVYGRLSRPQPEVHTRQRRHPKGLEQSQIAGANTCQRSMHQKGDLMSESPTQERLSPPVQN